MARWKSAMNETQERRRYQARLRYYCYRIAADMTEQAAKDVVVSDFPDIEELFPTSHRETGTQYARKRPREDGQGSQK
jgi:hypothetical protein